MGKVVGRVDELIDVEKWRPEASRVEREST
jgi:hypothetical protein